MYGDLREVLRRWEQYADHRVQGHGVLHARRAAELAACWLELLLLFLLIICPVYLQFDML